ncbi:MAG: hypothetical protein F6K50_41770 [Moorea sp. SIO3I7]|nr:hypothetical protein [Moorena sp. SIO3I7]NEO45757.1 hypothetical protein [Moorena sp. SIO4A3]
MPIKAIPSLEFSRKHCPPYDSFTFLGSTSHPTILLIKFLLVGSAYQSYPKLGIFSEALPTLRFYFIKLVSVGSAYQSYPKLENFSEALPTLRFFSIYF